MGKRKSNKHASTKRSQGYLSTKVIVGVLGLVLSVVLHELFHVIMHWGHITHVNFFPKWGVVFEISSWTPPGYDLEGEEIVAYGITILVVFITMAIIFKIGDSEDKRSTGQILFPKDKKMQKLSSSKLLELSDLDDRWQTTRVSTRRNKPRRQRKTS